MFNLPTSKSSPFVFKLFKLVGTLTKLAIFNLFTSAFQTIKPFLATKSDVPKPIAWFI